MTSPTDKHAEAVNAFEQGQLQEAIRLFEELLQEQPSSELWNDWATVQAAAGRVKEAEAGLLRALELDPKNRPARADLAILLLSLGEKNRAVALIEDCLPFLTLPQQELLRAARAAAGVVESGSRRVLVVHDVFPRIEAEDAGARILQVLRALHELSHQITLIVRDARNREQWSAPLRDLPMKVFAGDAERLRPLGIESPAQGWSLGPVLQNGQFDIAILTQNFSRGLSVPEQYLDEIRRHSPQTRITILSEDFHGARAAQQAAISGELKHHEMAEDWAQREQEGLQRADMAIVPDHSAQQLLRERLPSLPIAVVTPPATRQTNRQQRQSRRGFRETMPRPAQDGPAWDDLKTKLAEALACASRITAKAAAAEPFSISLVDAIYAQLLQQTSGDQRVYARLDFYVQFAEQLLRHGKAYFAREQLRHIFGWLGESVKLAPALAQPLGMLKRCYRQLNDEPMALRCAEEARRCFTSRGFAGKLDAPAVCTDKDQPLISLIVPTYNRVPILKKCLAALEAQTVSPQSFEVIVIDDGSSDGTEAMMQQYRPKFQLQYLRQKNSGTGTARRNGVAHARGEYLLLMNDDTICEPGVIEQHLLAQHMYSSERWAVLGNFEYPAEARKRALTHFFQVNPFMFPQVEMEAGCPYGYSHFITCNLSIRRDAVERVGSFDGTYMLSEDTEMGIKLFETGYSVVYHPAAHAWHDHLPYAMSSLIRRARVYGGDYFHMFRKHPRVMREWAMPVKLDAMDERNAVRIRAYVEQHRENVLAAVLALQRWDDVDFEPILADQQATEDVLCLFHQSVPAVHWFYLFERMLEVMGKELATPELTVRAKVAFGAAGGK